MTATMRPTITRVKRGRTSARSYTLDSRVRSRLDPLLVEFGHYSRKEIQEIVRDRAESGLMPDSIRKSVLNKIARLSDGDARVAIQTLHHAAVRADETRTGQIRS